MKFINFLCALFFISASAIHAQQAVTGLQLINSDTNLPIAGFNPMADGAVLDLATLPTTNLNINALTNPDSVGSVLFGYDSVPAYRVETVRPYAIAGDDAGVFRAWTPAIGDHTVTATPYTQGGGGGTSGNAMMIRFSVINSGTPPPMIPSVGSGTYIEQNGIVAMEAENADSPLGLWVKKTTINNYTGTGYLEFTGNEFASGPAVSPLVFKFKINTGGLYYLDLRCAKETIDGRTDVANDCYVRVEGDYGPGPNAGRNHTDDATLSVLKSDTKYFGGANLQFDWSYKFPKYRLDPGGTDNKRNPYYNFKAGKEYTLVLSGRSKFFKIDRIVFWHTTASSSGAAENTSLPESTRALIPDHSHAAISAFPTITSGTVPYYKDTARNALAIDASIVANRGKFVRASRTFDGINGIYSLHLTTLVEEDGESTYRFLVNSVVKATYQNPRIGAGSPLDLTENVQTWTGIELHYGDSIAIESNTHTNGEIPENGGTAWARGRWRNLDLSYTATSLRSGPPPGRLAIVTDGNAVDPDDVCATPVALAMIRAAGMEQRLVHYSHACELTNKPQFTAAGAAGIAEEQAREGMNQVSCDGTASRWGGFGHLTFWNCRNQKPQVVAELKAAMNASTAVDPLWIVEAGEPDVLYDAALLTNPGVMQHVHVITHHPNNDAGSFHHLDDILAIQSPGAHVARITDQNVNLKTSLSDWYWARDHGDPRIRWVWERGEFAATRAYVDPQFKFAAISGKFDCSDAGMTLYWLTGANVNPGLQLGSPSDIRTVLEDYIQNGSSGSVNADAGPDIAWIDFDANGNETLILDGSGSSAANTTISQYIWKEGGTQIATGMRPLVSFAVGTHIVTLTVSSNSGTAHSDTVTITISSFNPSDRRILVGDPADATVRQGGTIQDGASASLMVGKSFTAGERSAILVFQLPNLGSVTDPFVTASFGFHFKDTKNMVAGQPDVDLYALPKRTASTILATDYYTGPFGAAPNASALQASILTPASAIDTRYNTLPSADETLRTYLNTQYASGGGIGQYVFLRFSLQGPASDDVRYNITSADGGMAGTPETRPLINYTVNAPFPDSDLDGMPDQWEMQMFGSLNRNPRGDEDGDLTSNLDEFIAGTFPTDANSVFRVNSLTIEPSGAYTLHWRTVADRTYTVMKSIAIDGAWVPVSAPLAGNGAERTFTEEFPHLSKAFYKISVSRY